MNEVVGHLCRKQHLVRDVIANQLLEGFLGLAGDVHCSLHHPNGDTVGLVTELRPVQSPLELRHRVGLDLLNALTGDPPLVGHFLERRDGVPLTDEIR